MIVRTVALSLLLLAQPAMAARVYKVVGPDGKITFTDQPQSTESGQTLKAPAAPSSGPLGNMDDPALAATRAYVAQIIIETGSVFCMTYASKTRREVIAARDGWRHRNADLLEKKNAVLRDTIGIRAMHQLADKMKEENEIMIGKLQQATLEEKEAWCAQTPTTYAAPELDPSRNSAMSKAIMGYQLKRR